MSDYGLPTSKELTRRIRDKIDKDIQNSLSGSHVFPPVTDFKNMPDQVFTDRTFDCLAKQFKNLRKRMEENGYSEAYDVILSLQAAGVPESMIKIFRVPKFNFRFFNQKDEEMLVIVCDYKPVANIDI